MKASELIGFLQKAIEDNGDLPLRMTMSQPRKDSETDCQEFVGFTTMVDKTNKPYCFMLCDNDAMDSFS